MYKKRLAVGLLVLSMGLMAGCSDAEETYVERARAVEVMEVKQEAYDVYLPYIGTVNSKDIVSYSFKSPGKIAKVLVDNGDVVKAGDILAELDTQELKFQLDAARATYQTANHSVTKAKEALSYDQDTFERMEKLYDAQAISKDTLEQIELKKVASDSSYNQAIQQSNAAKVDLDYKNYLMSNSVLKADADGMVVSTHFQEGEQIGAYTPVVTLRSEVQVINVGIAQDDLDEIAEGTLATIDVNGQEAKGYINSISEAPDAATRTYNAEVIVNNSSFRLGSIAKVKFDVGQSKGIWIPVKSVLSDGESFVYIVENERAFKRTVDPVFINDGLMEVKGLEQGEFVVTSGTKNISDGFKVTITE